jgi:phytol kinase
MSNVIGIIVSYFFVFLIIFFSTSFSNNRILSSEGSRKFIHIGVSNWWIIAMIFFDNPFYASIVPFSFVIINYISYKKQVFKAMERSGGKEDLGTVYFAISLFILSLITFSNISHPYIGALGILIMGYGDGLAAVFGKRVKSPYYNLWGSKKSFSGSLAMFIFSFIPAFILLIIYNPSYAFINSLIIAALATVLEFVTPAGFDNLTVPLLIPLVYSLIM